MHFFASFIGVRDNITAVALAGLDFPEMERPDGAPGKVRERKRSVHRARAEEDQMVGELRAETSVTYASRAVLRRSKLRMIACSFAVVFGCSSGDHSDSVTLRGWYESTVVSSGVESIGFSDATHYIMWKTCDTSVETCVSTGTYAARGLRPVVDGRSKPRDTELPFSVLSASTLRPNTCNSRTTPLTRPQGHR